MAGKELRKLKRRELLEMLLVECREAERLQKEADEIKTEYDELKEGYERLKQKLNVKDERLNQKDATIAELRRTIEEIKASRLIELEEAGSIAEAALRLNGVFEAAQRAAEQYLINVRRVSESVSARTARLEENKISSETGWRAGIKRKTTSSRTRQLVTMNASRTRSDMDRRTPLDQEDTTTEDTHLAASGDIHG